MPSDIIKRDQNRVTVGAGVASSDGSTIKMISVDSVTNRVLASVANNMPGTVTTAAIAKRDQNRTTVVMGVDSTGALREIATDEDGYILCDLIT